MSCQGPRDDARAHHDNWAIPSTPFEHEDPPPAQLVTKPVAGIVESIDSRPRNEFLIGGHLEQLLATPVSRGIPRRWSNQDSTHARD